MSELEQREKLLKQREKALDDREKDLQSMSNVVPTNSYPVLCKNGYSFYILCLQDKCLLLQFIIQNFDRKNEHANFNVNSLKFSSQKAMPFETQLIIVCI